MAHIRNFNGEVLGGKWATIEILNVITPRHFYGYLKEMEETRTEFLEMIRNLDTREEGVDELLEEEAYEGAALLVKGENGYYRATIKVKKEKKYVVWLGDWAIEIKSTLENLYTIPEELANVPYQAVCCGLWDVKPKEGNTWSKESVEAAKELLEGGTWTASFAPKTTETDAAWVRLRDEEGRSASTFLKRWGMAEEARSGETFEYEGRGAKEADLTIRRRQWKEYTREEDNESTQKEPEKEEEEDEEEEEEEEEEDINELLEDILEWIEEVEEEEKEEKEGEQKEWEEWRREEMWGWEQFSSE